LLQFINLFSLRLCDNAQRFCRSVPSLREISFFHVKHAKEDPKRAKKKQSVLTFDKSYFKQLTASKSKNANSLDAMLHYSLPYRWPRRGQSLVAPFDFFCSALLEQPVGHCGQGFLR
jgi:hypothetical protein